MELGEILEIVLEKEDCHYGNRTNDYEKLVKTLNYDSIDAFLYDNPGAFEAILHWINENYNDNEEIKDRLMEEYEIKDVGEYGEIKEESETTDE